MLLAVWGASQGVGEKPPYARRVRPVVLEKVAMLGERL